VRAGLDDGGMGFAFHAFREEGFAMKAKRMFAAFGLSGVIGCVMLGCCPGPETDGAAAGDHPTLPAQNEVADTEVQWLRYGMDVTEKVAETAVKWLHDQNDVIDVLDPQVGRRVRLTLRTVHRSSVTAITTRSYFVNADFWSPAGHAYSLDLFFGGTDVDGLEFIRLDIRSVNGQPRYTWSQQGGVWKQRPVPGAPPIPPEEKAPPD